MLAVGIARVLIAMLSLTGIVCILIPSILAFRYGIAWLLAYPVALIVFVIFAPKRKK
jgi:hypothetical protein